MTAERVLRALLIGGVGIGCAYILHPFFSAILWAGILVFCTWPVFVWLRHALRLPRGGAALVMVLLTAVLVVLPLAVAAPGGAEDVKTLRHSIDQWLLGGLPPSPPWLRAIPIVGPTFSDTWDAWSADLSAMENFFKPYLGMIGEGVLSLLLGIAGGVAQFLLALFIAFFFWLSGDAMAVHLSSIIRRIAGSYADRLITVTGNTVRGTVYGILGTALIQGILTGFGLWLSGVPRPVLLGAVAGFLAVLPIGAPLVWIPSAIWLMGTGHTAWGVFLAVYGVVLVSGADHVIRPYFIARGAQLPFLLTVLGVLGGVLAFGLLGVFVGPVLLAVGFTLVAEFARAGETRPLPSTWR
jgi:predicted PurR-regulated permease PerM